MQRVLHAEVLVDLSGRVGLVQGIEMDAGPSCPGGRGTARRPTGCRLGRSICRPNNGRRPSGAARERGAEGQLGHPGDPGTRVDGHDPGEDRHTDARQVATLLEVVEIAVVEEELGADIVGPGVDLPLEVVHFLEPVGGVGMAFGEPRDADTEPARVREIGIRLHEPDQIVGVLEAVVGPIIVGQVPGRIAAKGQDVLDPRTGIAVRGSPTVLPSSGRRRSGERWRSGSSLGSGFSRSGRESLRGSILPPRR